MPGIVQLVNLISSDVVSGLAASGYPPLTDGGILLGRQTQFTQGAPPRIIFTPARSSFSVWSAYDPSNVAQGGNAPEQLLQNQQRSIYTDRITFEVRCWGSASPPDPAQDFDITQALYQQVIASAHSAVGSYSVEPGEWTDANSSASQLIRDGREFVFGITFDTPVLDKLLQYARSSPSGPLLAGAYSVKFQLPTGSSETVPIT